MFQVRDNALGYIKYVGISKAVVIDNNDPLARGRIRVNSPVLGETGWIPYLTAPGMFSVPEPDDVVYIQCDGGFYTHPIAWGNFTRGEDGDVQVPEEFQRSSPTNRGFYSPDGHLIEIDDGEDIIGTGKGIRITTSDESVIHIKEDPTEPGIHIETSNGQIIDMDGLTDVITITTSGGTTATLDGLADTIALETTGGANALIDGISDSITAEVAFGDNIELSAANGFQVDTPAAGGTHLSQKGGKVDILSALDATFTSTNGAITIEAGNDITLLSDTGNITAVATQNIEMEAAGGAKLKLAAGKVGLGGPAGELLEEVSKLADELSKLAMADSIHVHPTAVGPSGPPTNAANMVAVQTAATAIKTIVDLIKGGI